MRQDCPDAATCSRQGGLCQCAEDEIREARVQSSGEAMAGVRYELLREAAVARTILASDEVMVDVDGDGRIIGVEVLDGSDWRDALVILAREGRLAVVRNIS